MIRSGLAGMVLALSASAALADGGHSHAGIGQAADTQGARLVTVRMTESEDGQMLFDPTALRFTAGETVRLRIENIGAQEHEFVMDTPDEIAEHKQMMADMPDMQHATGNAIRLDPGETAEFGWTFGEPGSYEFACLLLGHYEAGMHGLLAVE